MRSIMIPGENAPSLERFEKARQHIRGQHMGTGDQIEMLCPWCYREIRLYLDSNPYCKFCGKNVIPSRLALKLQAVVKKYTDEYVEPYIRRIYSGHWQRSAGAWLWTMHTSGWNIGSCWTAKLVVKAKEISIIREIGTIELLVEKDD